MDIFLTWNLQDGKPWPLLPPIAPKHVGKKCLVLDLDETLVHINIMVYLSLRFYTCF